ncbi:hypothetical protein IFVP69_C1150056 [Vibrio parahaemolyticus]
MRLVTFFGLLVIQRHLSLLLNMGFATSLMIVKRIMSQSMMHAEYVRTQ